ncbi:MAG: DUF1540 domain-containing protein [Clostridiales bacterium]|nr:DUF1540 domain-containing protein [Clostridiales bacterium]
MALSGVRCTVRDCYFWQEGHYCNAKEILITHDEVGRKFPESMDAPQIDQIVAQTGPTEAYYCYDTCCKTFRPKG